MDKDRLTGKMKEGQGAAKQKLGEVTNDENLEARGKAERTEGKAQGALGKVKDAARDAAGAVKDAVRRD